MERNKAVAINDMEYELLKNIQQRLGLNSLSETVEFITIYFDKEHKK